MDARGSRDLEGVARYLMEHHPEFAQTTVKTLYDAAASLTDFAERGRPGREPGTRELVLNRLPYAIVYTVRADAVWIARVLHTARKWP
jgi:plasmid stabilization system protein ParE